MSEEKDKWNEEIRERIRKIEEKALRELSKEKKHTDENDQDDIDV